MIDENTPEEEKNEKYMELGKERTLKMMQMPRLYLMFYWHVVT